MKKIYINKTKRCLVFGKTLLIPGSQAVDAIDEKKFPTFQTLVDNGDLVVSDDPASAVKSANTQQAVNGIKELGNGDKKVDEAADNRTKQLNKIDEEAKTAAKNAKSKEGEEEE